MKIKLLLSIAIIASTAVLLTAFSGGYPGGAPAGYTGSPGDGHNCVACHGGSASNTTGMISTNIPSTGYKPDSTYQITVTVTGSGAKGFEVSPQNASGAQLGTLIAGTNNHLTGGTKYVTQNAKINSTPATWVFSWKAPAAGTGDVTFYAAYTISKPVTKLENITVQENTSQPLSVVATAGSTSINLGDSTQLSATATGGSGSYTYNWTSYPAGFTSTLQNPWVKPLLTTTYIVQVSDGTNTASSDVTVTVHNPQGIVPAGEFAFSIGPNPSSGPLTLRLSGNGKQQANLKVYNISGRIVYAEDFVTTSTVSVRNVDFSNLPKGVYLVQIISEGITRTKSIILN